MKRIVSILCLAAFISLSLGVAQSEAGWRRYRGKRGGCSNGSCATAAPCAGGVCR